MLRTVTPAEVATGPRLDVTWAWELRLYCGLSDWDSSQRQIDVLLPQILALWRDDPTLGELIEWWRIRDGGQPIEFNTSENWMRKTLLVEAVVESVGLEFAAEPPPPLPLPPAGRGYTFSTTLTGAPGSGVCRLDDPPSGDARRLYVSNVTRDGETITDRLLTVTGGMIARCEATPGDWFEFTISNRTARSGYVEYGGTVTALAGIVPAGPVQLSAREP